MLLAVLELLVQYSSCKSEIKAQGFVWVTINVTPSAGIIIFLILYCYAIIKGTYGLDKSPKMASGALHWHIDMRTAHCLRKSTLKGTRELYKLTKHAPDHLHSILFP